jgi:hypothetical protein
MSLKFDWVSLTREPYPLFNQSFAGHGRILESSERNSEKTSIIDLKIIVIVLYKHL